MKLSQLVKYHQMMKNLNTSSLSESITQNLDKIFADIKSVDVGLDDQVKEILSELEAIHTHLDSFNKLITNYEQLVGDTVKDNGVNYFQLSYQLYDEIKNDPPEYIADRYLFNQYIYKNEIRDALYNRLSLYTDWHHPGFLIRPENGEFLEPMKSCDPLYIADESEHLLRPTKNLYNAEYQNRLRYFLINDDRDHILNHLPDGQIGFIVAIHFFNFKPIEILKRYLEEFWKKLKPGGVVLFSYNNCDYPDAVKQVENFYQTYVPGGLLRSLVELHGFEILNSFDLETNVSWIEIKKPGILESMRGGQTLAKIITQKADRI
jgi:hypothetical protein